MLRGFLVKSIYCTVTYLVINSVFHYLIDFDFDLQRRKMSRRQRRQQRLYFELGEAMDCLEHICTEGCISVGPYDIPRKNRVPCNKFSTCQGLQLSIQHFANCKNRMNQGCVRCKRMWQLFKLHSSICELPESACKVPLCKRFKMRGGEEVKNKKEEVRWGLLVKKVVVARATSSLLLQKTKLVEEEAIPRTCGEDNDNHKYNYSHNYDGNHGYVVRNLVC